MVPQKHLDSVARSATLTIPELEQSEAAVLNTLVSVHSRRSYAYAIEGFIAWYCSEPSVPPTPQKRRLPPQEGSASLRNPHQLQPRCFFARRMGTNGAKSKSLNGWPPRRP
jgi:hypothetical protein